MSRMNAWLRCVAAAGLALALTQGALAAGNLKVYGPGGPAPAMKEAAKVFAERHGLTVEVTAGPTPSWSANASKDADVIFSGAENMMSDFAKAMPDLFDLAQAEPLYLRPAAILVRPGNPKAIRGFADLLKPGIRVMTVGGAGQIGLWEDVAGRKGEIKTVKALRKNLQWPEPANSALARDKWQSDKNIDAWLIWNIWQTSNPTLAETVEIEEPYRIYRDAGVVLTRHGQERKEAREFIDFLKSEDGRAIFRKWGWKA